MSQKKQAKLFKARHCIAGVKLHHSLHHAVYHPKFLPPTPNEDVATPNCCS